MQPQRLLVPLFQRPYVWNEELQWEPLWRDLERVANRLLESPGDNHMPHFLGAVVLQQLASKTSDLQQRTVIDGQQRLTTLQLLLDALHAEISAVGAKLPAARLEPLIANNEAFRKNKEDQFKVWPTNRDRAAFNEVMGAEHPIDYEKLKHRSSRLARAHQFFASQFRHWLAAAGPEMAPARAEAIERSARELLQIVVIDLTAGENAQEIFETLNARGAVLTAADLIKNFVFQRMLEQGANVEDAYAKYWAQFETAFWEEEVSVGRMKFPRSSVFLNHWLVTRTGDEVIAREVFSRFKRFADFDARQSMAELLEDIHRAAGIYRDFTEKGEVEEGPIDRTGIFVYRARTLESEVVKPVLLALLDHPGGPVSTAEVEASLDVMESWLVRRMLIRATAKSYNKQFADVAAIIRNSAPGQISQTLRQYFSSQTSETAYWPDDDEVRLELRKMPIYRKLNRGRLRMVLESIEDHLRGWIPGQASLAGMRIPRSRFAIEHVLPQAWHKHWALPEGVTEAERDARIHRLGNLTLLTKRLNSTVSNGPWLGPNGKAKHLQEKDVVLLNSRLLASHGAIAWDDAGIDKRTDELIDTILSIWKVPHGHKISMAHQASDSAVAVEVADLIEARLLSAGQRLHSRPGKYGGHIATILSDGRIEVEGVAFNSPSQAGISVRKKHTNGWIFWRLDAHGNQSLADIRSAYIQSVAPGDSDEGDLPEDETRP